MTNTTQKSDKPLPYRLTRPLYRPRVHILRAICKMFIPIVLIIAFFIAAASLGWISRAEALVGFPLSAPWLCVGAIAVYTALRTKSIIIWLVRVYQAFAPEEIRRMCNYKPSCSEYMILAVEKYGVIRGVRKGWHRLMRCGGDAGGEDYP